MTATNATPTTLKTSHRRAPRNHPRPSDGHWALVRDMLRPFGIGADLSSCVRHVTRQWRSGDVPDYMVPRTESNRGQAGAQRRRGSTAPESATEAGYFRRDRTRRTQTPKSAALAISPSTRCMTEPVTMAEVSASAETAPKTLLERGNAAFSVSPRQSAPLLQAPCEPADNAPGSADCMPNRGYSAKEKRFASANLAAMVSPSMRPLTRHNEGARHATASPESAR